jgi:hypothetical protein
MIKILQKIILFFFAFVLIIGCQTQEKKISSAQSQQPSKKQEPNFGNRPFQFSYTALCHMKCWNLKPDAIKKHISQTRPKTNEKWLSRKPCPLFVVDSLEAPSKKAMLSVLFAACDSSIKILRVVSLKDKKACPECKDANKDADKK